jgi:hypothetical protein
MYGKHRVVLRKEGRYNPARDLWYNGIIALCGSKSGQGGSYNPIGYWYKSRMDRLFYADLIPSYGERKNSDLVQGQGGLRTAQALREFVMTYAQEHDL